MKKGITTYLSEEIAVIRELPEDKHRKLMILALPAHVIGCFIAICIIVYLARLHLSATRALACLALLFPIIVAVAIIPHIVTMAALKKRILSDVSGKPPVTVLDA